MLHRTAVTDILTGAQFNDYEPLDTKLLGRETKDTKLNFSTRVCAGHAKQHKLADGLDKGMGAGRCGIVGCEKAAAHNYCFFSNTDPLSLLDDEPGHTLPAVIKVTPTVPRVVARKARGVGTPTTLKGIR